MVAGARACHPRVRHAVAALVTALIATVVPLAAAPPAEAATVRSFAPRFSVNTSGEIILRGNASLTCQGDATCPDAQDRAGSSLNNNNGWEMKYVDVDGKSGIGKGTANSSRADVPLPSGSRVLFAGLYWGADTSKPGGGGAAHPAEDASRKNRVKLLAPGSSMYTEVAAAHMDVTDGDGGPYQAFADVTSTVAGAGPGDYTVAEIQTARGRDRYAGWALVVAYEEATQPSRNLVVYDGFGLIQDAGSDRALDVSLSGFQTPPSGPVRTSLGVVAWEGDVDYDRDSLTVISALANPTIGDAPNPATNLFNSTVSDRGSEVTTRNPAHRNTFGVDIDRIDADGILGNGATSATLHFQTDGQDRIYPGVLTFATELFSPRLTATKVVTDDNGGAAVAGEELEYAVTVTNTGMDTAAASVLTDSIPTHATYVPGTLGVDDTGRSDGAGDDTAEVSDAGRVTARLGAGATSAAGGVLAVNATTTVRFRVRIDAGAPHLADLPNTAGLSYRGAQNGLALSGDSNTVTTTVIRPRADLAITKSGDPGDVTLGPGAQAVYTLTVVNQGPLADPGVTVTDTLPAGLTVASAVPSQGACSGAGTATATCALGALDVGPTVTVTVTADVGASAADPSTDTARVAGTLEDLDPANNEAAAATAVNRPPTADDDSATTDTGSAVAVSVKDNDTDPDAGAVLTVTSPGAGANGATAVNPSGGVTYTPNTGFAGTDTFTYTVSDGRGGTDMAAVTVVVRNAAPMATDDEGTTTVDTPVSIAVLANDTDANGDPLTVTSVTDPAHGTAAVGTGGVTYAPDSGHAGTDTFDYAISDGRGGSATGTVTVTVPNAAPAAAGDTGATAYLSPIDVDVLGNDRDPNGDALTAGNLSAPRDAGGAERGTVAPAPGGALRYTPPLGFSGTVTFTYTASDPGGATSTPATVTIAVRNATPAAADDSAVTAYLTPVDIPVLGNDTDPDGDTLTVSGTGATSGGGAVVANADGTLTYTPPAGFSGDDAFTYTVDDGDGGTDTTNVTVRVGNALPVAAPDERATDIGTAVTIPVLGNDTDPNPGDADALAVKAGSVSAPTDAAGTVQGTVTDNRDATVTYAPPSGFQGSVTFAYTAVDPRGGEDTATVTVRVVNTPPVARADAEATPPATGVTVAVTANDTDQNGDALTVSDVAAPGHGTVAFDRAAGTVTYTPDAAWVGIDTFAYTIEDGRGGSSSAPLTITTLDAFPMAVADEAATPRNTATIISVLSNDTDPNGDVVSLVSVDAASAGGGTATIDGRGTPERTDDVVLFTPRTGFTGTDTFTYGIDDSRGGTARGTVTVTVPNIAPTAGDDRSAIPTDGTADVHVLGNDADPDGDGLTVRVTSEPANGSVGARADGTIRYVPRAGYAGRDRFTYEIDDGRGGTATATVEVTVENAPPVGGDDHAGTGPGRAVLVAQSANDSDRNGDPITISDFDPTTPGGGTVATDDRATPSLVDDLLTYTPAAGFKGDDTFTYEISDGRGGSDRATVTVTVTDADPVALADLAATSHATPVTVPVLANDFDPNPTDALRVVPASLSDPLSAAPSPGAPSPGAPSPGTAVVAGTVTLNPDNTVTYSPPTGFAGVVSFTYQVTDGNPGTATPTATVTITVANAKPVPAPDTATTGRDRPVDIDVTENDTDANGDRLRVIGLSAGAEGGSVSENASGGVTFTPRAGFTGTDTFTYTVDDGHGGQESASVTVIVPNEAPVAADDAVSLGPDDEGRAIPVLANDTDPSDDPLTVARIVDEPLHGTVAVRDDGSILYTPDAGYAGPDRFTYEVSDGRGGLAVATVSIDVQNAPPGAGDDDAATGAARPVLIRVLDNDRDANPGQTVALTGIASPPANGIVVDNRDGSVTYTPAAGFKGVDTFVYGVSDGAGGSDAATVSVTVSDAAPVGVDDRYTTPHATPLTFDVRDNDFDPNPGDVIVVVPDSLTPPLDDQGRVTGTVVRNGPASAGSGGSDGSRAAFVAQAAGPDGTLTYTPPPGFVGAVTFSYAVSDGSPGGATDAAVVTIDVDNVVPTAVDDSAGAADSAPVAVDVLANDTDGNGDRLRIVAASGPAAGGTVVVSDNATPSDPSDDRIVYTPPAGFGGADRFTYAVDDGRGGTATATVTVDVKVAVAQGNAPPRFTTEAANTLQTVRLGEGLAPLGATDPDGDVLGWRLVGDGSLPSGVTLRPDGTFAGAPTTPGTYRFVVEVCDTAVPPGCDETTVFVVVPDDRSLPVGDSTVLGSEVTLPTPPPAPGRHGQAGDPQGRLPGTGAPGGLALNWALLSMAVLTRWALRLTRPVD